MTGYLEEDGISPASTTETYAAIRLDVDTRRWAGVPFYLRTGKRLGRRVTEIAVVFKRAPHLPFERHRRPRSSARTPSSSGSSPTRASRSGSARRCPAPRWRCATSRWTSATAHSFTESSPEAYERLILDVLLGDPPLFPRHEEVELSLEDPRPDHRVLGLGRQPEPYDSGSWGPASADEMLARDGRAWRRP